MALRLTAAIPQIDDDRASLDDVSLVEDLQRRAEAALEAADTSAYAAQFAGAAELTDPQRRYQAEVQLLVLGLGHAARAGRGEAETIRTYVAVADAALTALERESREPVLLSCAGIACHELWALDAARPLFTAARRLDPDLVSIDANLAAAAARARGHRPRRPLHSAVPGLVRRARSVANRASPAAGLTLSLCMIVKDEEQMLPRCLEAIHDVVDEIVIVDTGSTDATIEIARSFGARVLEHRWTGSFADARNVSFDAATGDWIMYLDADEVLVADDARRLRALTARTWREAFSVTETSFTGELGSGGGVVNSTVRVFRNRPEYRFEGRIHEQIVGTLPTWAPNRIEHTTVRIDHYGYLGDVRDAKEKSKRNIALLRAQQAAETAPSPFLHFNLGSEYVAAGELIDGASELATAWQMLGEQGIRETREYAPVLLSRLTEALVAAGRAGVASEYALEGIAMFPHYTDLVLIQARIARDEGETARARELYERCIEMGDAPAAQGGAIGAGSYLPRIALAQLALADGDAERAVALLDWCAENHPDHPGIAEPYALARLAQGAAPDEIAGELRSRLPAIHAPARVALARRFAATGRRGADAAVAEYRLALKDSGGRRTDAVRAGLAELLLGAGRFPQAAAEAALVGSDDADAYAALGCRIEVVARICDGDHDGARAALGRAGRVGISRGQLDLLEAWLSLAGGEPARDGLSVASIPLLATIAEMLMRAGAREPTAQLVALLTRSRLPAREQTELLADMHRRCGDNAAAARLWLAVCAQAPDARARLGLARIALAQGMTEDALAFACDAVSLDPACAPARELVADLRGAVDG